MGCDIHSWVEVRRPNWEGEKIRVRGLPFVIGEPGHTWRLLDEDDCIFPNTYYDPESRYEPFTHPMRHRPLDNRNYTLFALLADVRNGRGFAGIPTGDRITPLSDPRGVPLDASYGYLAEVEEWGPDGHSHTWFTLAELTDNALYGQRLVRTGAIPGPDYEKFRDEGGKPESWSGSISGPGIRTVSPQEYDAGVRAEPLSDIEIARARAEWFSGPLREGETQSEKMARFTRWVNETRTYVQYVWEDSLVDAIGELSDAIEALKRYAADLPPKGATTHDGVPYSDEPGYYGHGTLAYTDLRIVMFFDN